jgi:hypothetical protein
LDFYGDLDAHFYLDFDLHMDADLYMDLYSNFHSNA